MGESTGVFSKPLMLFLDFPKLIDQMTVEVFPSVPANTDEIGSRIHLENAWNAIHQGDGLATELREVGDDDYLFLVVGLRRVLNL